MPVRVVKDDNESTERCITRFNKKVQAAPFVSDVKKKRYFKKKSTKRQVRIGAIIREQYRAKAQRAKHYS